MLKFFIEFNLLARLLHYSLNSSDKHTMPSAITQNVAVASSKTVNQQNQITAIRPRFEEVNTARVLSQLSEKTATKNVEAQQPMPSRSVPREKRVNAVYTPESVKKVNDQSNREQSREDIESTNNGSEMEEIALDIIA
jgi:hypothetical protein